MPDTVIARVNEIYCNEPNKFIFKYRRGRTIVNVDTTRVDRDTDDSNKNHAPKDPPYEFHSTEYTEEEPVIPDPKIDLNINHETPKEQV